MLIKQQREKISHCSWLNNFNYFHKKYKLQSKEYAVFLYIWLLYTKYVAFLSLFVLGLHKAQLI